MIPTIYLKSILKIQLVNWIISLFKRNFELIVSRFKVNATMKILKLLIFVPGLLLLVKISYVHCNGRFLEPPSRSSIWRFSEFKDQNPPVNYNDNHLDCGGALVIIIYRLWLGDWDALTKYVYR